MRIIVILEYIFMGSEINGGLLSNTHFNEQFLVSTCTKFHTVVP